MTKYKKILLLSLITVGSGASGTYYCLWQGNVFNQTNNEEIENTNLETFSPPDLEIINPNSETSSEVAKEENLDPKIIVEDNDTPTLPIINRFGKEDRRRKIDLATAKSKVEVLRDYTLRVGVATGWFLDYVLPESPQKYPTKWFIATNSHVVEYIHFDQSNPYKQILPKGENAPDKYFALLIKENVEQDDRDFDQSRWDGGYSGRLRRVNRDWNVLKKQDRNDHSKYSQLYFQERNPKLVYFPYQYLGEDNSKWPSDDLKTTNYSSDFAVMEVDFKEEWIARFMTRNFYDKYDLEVGTRKTQALDFFAKPIAEQYSNKDIYEKDLHIFTAGYPISGIMNKSTSNYNSVKEEAARFAYSYSSWRVPIAKGDYLLGHMNMTKTNLYYGDRFPDAMLTWNNQPFFERGYYYFTDDYYKGEIGGSSGSLNVLETGEVLGLTSRGSAGGRGTNRMIVPLRNKEIKGLDGKVLFPAYDLLEGVEGQKNSYRDQIREYFLKKGKKTALSRLRKWSF